MLIDFVGHYPQALGSSPLADLANLLRGVDRTGWIRRGDEQQHLGAFGQYRLELLDGDLVALLGAGEDRNGFAAGKLDGLRIGGPVRSRNDDLVAWIKQGCESVVHRLLAAIG